MGQEIKIPFSEDAVEDIHQYLTLQDERGESVAFEVSLDKFKLVRKTTDPERLFDYRNFIKPSSKVLEIVVYNYGDSHHSDRTQLYLTDLPEEHGTDAAHNKKGKAQADNGLSGVEVEKMVNERMVLVRQEFEFNQLKKEYQTLLEQLKEKDKEIEELEDDLDKLEQEKAEMLARESPLKGVLGEVGAGVVESFIKRNPQTLAKIIPGGESLAGLLEEDEKKRLNKISLPAAQDAEVVFTEKANLVNHDPAYILVQNIRAQFNDQEFSKVLQILDVLIVDKSRLDTVHALVTEN
jgi:hypothetical protein